MNYRISYYDTTLLSLKKWRNQDGNAPRPSRPSMAMRRAADC
jgi:hypothetical protein